MRCPTLGGATHWARAAAVFFVAGCGAVFAAAPPFAIRWVVPADDPSRAFVEVSGLSQESSQRLHSSAELGDVRWQTTLPVYALPSNAPAGGESLPMLGSYRIEENTIRFVPQFPLAPDVDYRAVLHPEQRMGTSAGDPPLVATFRLPPRAAGKTVVSAIYPSADTLPENLLKFYLHFSGPMRGGHVYEHIHLRDSDGREVELPFLELDEELWNPAMTRLTLLLDPGRIKRGVRPLVEIGAAIRPGVRYTLTIDPEWRDAAGQPLRERFVKSFAVSDADRTPPEPNRWKLTPPALLSRAALTIDFGKSLDQALASRVIRVETASGAAIEGDATLAAHETRWSFVPDTNWQPGNYRLAIDTTIEDIAGNNIGKPFDVDVSERIEHAPIGPVVYLPFSVR